MDDRTEESPCKRRNDEPSPLAEDSPERLQSWDDGVPTEHILEGDDGGCFQSTTTGSRCCFCSGCKSCDNDRRLSECGLTNCIMTACPTIGHSCTAMTYSWQEISRHNTEESAWLVVGNDVFDVTKYVSRHPGGKESILRKSGGMVDCTQDFFFHSKKGHQLWKSCYIGKIQKCQSQNITRRGFPIILGELLNKILGGIMARVHPDAVA